MKQLFFRIYQKFRLLKTDIPVLYLASRDKRTPVSTRFLIAATLIYFFSPVDFVPDFIPLLGLADDFFMVPFLVSIAVKTVPYPVLSEAKLKLKNAGARIKKFLFISLLVCFAAAAAWYGYYYYLQHTSGY